MLSRCSHCDRPFVITDAAAQPRCPHCGRDVEAAKSGGAAPARAESAPELPSAVVAEGSRPHPPAPGVPGRHPAPRPAPPGFRDGLPAWEQRDRSLPGRFFRTLADACFRPVAFFTHLSREGARGITWFAYTCLLLGTAGQAAWRLVMLPGLQAMLTQAKGGLSEADVAAARAEDNPLVNALLNALDSSERLAEQLSRLEVELWATLLLAPLTAFFTIHLLAGLVHFSVQSFRPPDQEPVAYDVTYRFLLYAFAPMIFGIVPTVGGLAGFFSFLLMLVAISRLHRVRVLGLVAGVLFPIMLLSWLWGEEALPRLAPPLTNAVGVVGVIEAAPAAPAGDENDDEDEDEDEEGSEYPPMPAPDRDHSVEVYESAGALHSGRVWESSLGRLVIVQHVDKALQKDGSRRLTIELSNDGERDMERLFVEHLLPAPAKVTASSPAVSSQITLDGEPVAGAFAEAAIKPDGVTWLLTRLPAKATARLTMDVTGVPARTLFDTAPSVGRQVAAPPPSDERAP